MAKITLKNYQELLLPDDRAVAIRESIEERRKEIETSGMSLSMFPLTVETVDGVWSGSMADVLQISDSSKLTMRIGKFSSVDGVKAFHQKHGYGTNPSEYIKGYGVVDTKTKYLIAIGRAKIVDSSNRKSLVMIDWADKDTLRKWSDLWEIYESNLDAFGDLLPDDKIKLQ